MARRVEKTSGVTDRIENYIYDGDEVVLDLVDANGATGGVSLSPTTRYLHGPAVDQLERIDSGQVSDQIRRYSNRN